MIEKGLSVLEDEDTFSRIEMASERCGSRARFLADRFHRGPVNRRFRASGHQRLMHPSVGCDPSGTRSERPRLASYLDRHPPPVRG